MKKSPKKRKYFNQNVSSNERIRLTEYIYFRLLLFFRNIESWAPEYSAIGIISMIQGFLIGAIANILQLPIKSKFATGVIILPLYILNSFLFTSKKTQTIENKFNNRTNVNARHESLKGWGIVLLFLVSFAIFGVTYGYNTSPSQRKSILYESIKHK